jgi:uncharacterized membrane protein
MLTGAQLPVSQLVKLDALSGSFAAWLSRKMNTTSTLQYISRSELARQRMAYTQELITKDRSELEILEKQLVENIEKEEAVSSNINTTLTDTRTLGEKLADRIAEFGGSWTFILIFLFVLFGWMALNTWVIASDPFDPYPYILLNLVLSCLAALQAPVIMMSQRRQERRDRLQAENDYLVNRKAELEVRLLHEKMDYLMTRQWQTMLDLQEAQLAMLAELGPNPQE